MSETESQHAEKEPNRNEKQQQESLFPMLFVFASSLKHSAPRVSTAHHDLASPVSV